MTLAAVIVNQFIQLQESNIFYGKTLIKLIRMSYIGDKRIGEKFLNKKNI